jgi:hypothetical protein
VSLLYFVTPAWQRYELTAICLEQRRLVIEDLARHGVEARQVVIADDENLDIARSLGFETVEQNNHWLGRKFNDGEEWAGKHGADWIVPIGSDSWVDPAYFLPLPSPRRTRTSRMYAPVRPDRLATLRVGKVGAGPHMFHRSLMLRSGFRPAPDEIMRNTDHLTIRGLDRPQLWEWRDLHPLQYIGFRVPPYITQYQRLVERWGVSEDPRPFDALRSVYPTELVDRVERLMAIDTSRVET